MKVNDVKIMQFGVHKDFLFNPKSTGLHLIYGPNESGKSTLLRTLRSALFGYQPKERKDSLLFLRFERAGKEYTLKREGKKVELFTAGDERIDVEPSQLWWHGLDRKTYEKIFAITLEDLQGASFLSDVNVKSRFFGGDSASRFVETAKGIEKATTDLLVASTNGKRKINILLERLQQSKQTISQLNGQEHEYVNLRQKLENTKITEKELQDRLAQWKEYMASVDLVLRGWDTYRRAQEAKLKMSALGDSLDLEGEKFLALDEEIKQCQSYMSIWRGKEEGLAPENFSIDSPLRQYAQDIEWAHQQLGTWESLQKDCREGKAYLQHVNEQLQLFRKLQTTWRDDLPIPMDIDWQDGEKKAQQLRLSKERYLQWKAREPQAPTELDEAMLNDLSDVELGKVGAVVETVKESMLRQRSLMEEKDKPQSSWSYILSNVISGIVGIAAIVSYFMFHGQLHTWNMILLLLLVLTGGGIFAYGFVQKSRKESRREELNKAIREEEEKQRALICELPDGQSEVHDLMSLTAYYEKQRKRFYNRDVDLVRIHAYQQEVKRWQSEGESLLQNQEKAQTEWQLWLPQGANKTLSEDDLFGLRQEYDRYKEQLVQLEHYEQRLKEHKDKLFQLEQRIWDLWKSLQLEGTPSIGEMRRLYGTLKTYQQNLARWEQKESQRKNFREEYDNWHRKEKELLLQQEELVQKSGLKSATEYRQHLLGQGQYRQWKTIYKQSSEQLELLAPRKETYDLLCRRLKDGNKEKWLEEMRRSKSEIQGLEQQLIELYSLRGEITEALRTLSSSQEKEKALQEKAHLEAELYQAMEDWVTQVLIGKFIEEAQGLYERENQPQVLAEAAQYVEELTESRYTLDVLTETGEVFVKDKMGVRLDKGQWSSGLGDQVYLALRLSLAKCFGKQVEGLPIILDDILLRFDENRQKAALKLLVQLSQENQIFVFTCQEQLLRLGKALQIKEINFYTMGTDSLQEWQDR